MPTETPDPAAIARRLSKAQRELLCEFPDGMAEADDWWALLRAGLFAPIAERLTPLGLAVRAELERMEAENG